MHMRNQEDNEGNTSVKKNKRLQHLIGGHFRRSMKEKYNEDKRSDVEKIYTYISSINHI